MLDTNQNNSEYAVEMENITKVFLGTIIANSNVSIKVKKGTIHALVGENGAGKSTLMSILFGLYQPTKGEIKINGKEVVISGPVKASELGIGMVHQHFKLVDNFNIIQNIILGSEPVRTWQWVNYKKAAKQIKEISSKYKLDINPYLKIEHTSVGMQQRVEIIKVLYRGADIIVLDEPTAVLTPQEISGLLDIIRELKANGKTIIFISHKLDEVKAIADEITVIRGGKVVSNFEASTKSKSEIATLMVGRELTEVKNSGEKNFGKVLLSIKDLTVRKLESKSALVPWWEKLATKLKIYEPNPNKLRVPLKARIVKLFGDDESIKKKPKFIRKFIYSFRESLKTELPGLKNFNLEIRAGEIVAIAGIEGNGQRELVYALTGLSTSDRGQIFFEEKNVTNASIKKLYSEGMSYIPEDRNKYGLVLEYSIIDNMILQNVDTYPFSQFGFLRRRAIQSYSQKIINAFDVRGSKSGFAQARGLSGGNQQKAVLGRELTREHKIVVVVQPTRGLDIGAIEYIHSQILEEKKKGNAVVLVSYELSEVISLADRIVVLHSGNISGDIEAQNVKREELGLLMTGQSLDVETHRIVETGGEINV